MSAYRLHVKAGDKVLSQGTAWLLRPDLVVTAFHVVGKPSARAWLHETPGAAVTYTLSEQVGGEDREIPLDPVACDLGADVAILRAGAPLTAPAVLPLVAFALAKGATFEAEGYPGFRGGNPFTVSGRITDVRGEVSSTALQLLFDQGTDATWAGMSGSAVRVGGRVAGVLTKATADVATGWAASFEAVRRLERFLGAEDWATEVRELLHKLYPRPEHLLDVRAELGFPAEVGAGGDPGSLAAALAARATLDGADGLVRLLDAMGHDHPANGDVAPLRARVLAVVRPREVTGARSRAQRVREIAQWLEDPSTAGVAVLAPEGFRARAVVDEVLRQLATAGEVLPVRLVPERRTAEDERLYTTLSRDLWHAVPDPWRAVLDSRREASAMDRFEYGVEDLLVGPVREARRTMLFVIEGLDRVPADQLQQWGYLLARLSPRGLKLLVWGGEKLHGLMKPQAAGDAFSAFHVLKEARLGELSSAEVREMVMAQGGSEAAAAVLHRETGGHPALVQELLREHPEDAIAEDREAIEQRIVDGAHLGSLRRAVESDPPLQGALRALAAVEGETLPRSAKTRKAEARLSWLGILADAGAKSWRWVAPAMRVFAGEWS